jgi:glutathione S-transferase
MTLYCKAGPDGRSVGDCPFAHYVRMVLEEKNLEYELKPSTQETKPQWLIEHYQGKMPALRHRKECYVESSVIADYLDFFFPNPPLKRTSSKTVEEAEQVTSGLFPALAKYLKHTPDGDDDDLELRSGLEKALDRLETHLTREGRSGPFVVGTGEQLSLLDCSLTPKLYHMKCGLEEFKNNSIEIGSKFPAVQAYMDVMFARDSFVKSSYPGETVEWGWTNARGASR